MKSPTNYGSENEETRFIRRVAAPDRPNNKRRQKKRLAIAGATLGLLAASAGVGYTAMKNASSTSAVKTAKLEASMSNEARMFMSKLGDAFHPDFDKIDQDHDGKLSKSEIIADLTEKEMVDVDKVKASDLPEDIKKNVVALLESKLQSDSDCTEQVLDQRQVAVTRTDHEVFYYMLDVFCPRVTIAVTPPDQEEEQEGFGGSNQQTVEIPTPDGGTTEVVIVGEPEDGKQTIAIPDNNGGYTTTDVRSIETPTGEQKILIPNAEGDITPVVIPQVPDEVMEKAEQTGEQAQVVNVVTDSGETEQVIIQGEPDEHGDVTVQIPDNEGGYTETTATVQESYNGEQKIVVETTDGDVIQVPVPEPVSESLGNPSTEEQPAVQQVVEVTTSEGEKEQVALIGEAERGEQTVQITDESGRTTIDEVKVIETPSGEDKLVLPDVDTPVIVPEVPQEVIEQAEQTGEQVQAVNVVTDSGETEQVIIQGEPDEHGDVTVQIPDNEGGYTETTATVQESYNGEQKIVVETTDGDVIQVPVPEPVSESLGNPSTEEQPAVQQVVEVTTSEGEKEQVALIGEAERGEQTVQITDESGRTTIDEVKVIETPSGEDKLVLPDVDTPVIVPEVPQEVIEQAEQTGEQVQAVNVVTDSGETEQVIIQGEPDEHGDVTVQIPDNEGGYTETTATVQESYNGEQKIVVETTDGDVIQVPVPEPVSESLGNPSTEEQPAVQQVVEVTTSEGEKEQVALIGEAERGEQTVQITDESGRTTIDEVKVIETPSGEDKLVLPDVDTPVIVPEVPQEVIEQAEQTGEQVQAVNVVTDSGETEQVIIQGEPDEHGDVTVQIPDNEGGYTETTATVQESYNGEQKIVVETTDGDVIQVPVPEPVSESLGNPSTEEQPAVQQVVEVTTSEGEKEQVALIGEAERGEQTVQITDESGRTTIDEVKVIETPSGEDKLVLPDVDTPVIVPEVPQEVIEQAEQTGEQVQAVNVVTDSGETEQVIIQGEPDEHGDVTVQIPDNEGGYTETTATVQESYNGEQKIVVETTDGDVIQVPVPEPVSESLGNPSTEEQPAVQQVVEVTTSEGEKEQVALIGEAERGEQTVQITDESGRTTIDEVKVIETPSGEDKLVLPDVDTPVIVPEVPQEVIEQAEQTGEQVQAVNVVTDSGETEQVIIQGEPDEHGDVTVQIPDNEGGYTETTATVQESYNGEQKIVVETTDGDVIQVPVPEPVSESLGNPSTEEQPAVQQVVEVTTSEGEKEQVALIGEAERGEQTVQITDESGRTTIDEVKVIETPSGEDKLVLPDVDTPVIVPEVPQEVIEQAEQTGEQVQAVNVVTDSGETEQVIIQGEPDEHGDVTVQIPDNEGGYTETTATVQESYNGEQKIVVETTDGDVIQVPVPEPVSESLGNPSTEEQPAVQQVVEVTTSEGEKEQVALIGEAERGEQTVQITDESGRTTIDEVKVIETPSGEDKLVLPDVDTPVIVPEVPQEVIEQAEQTGEQVQAVNVVTDSGETEQVIIQGEPDEHGDVTVQIPDNEGGYTETTATVQESYNGEQKIVVETTDGDVIQVPVPEPVSESLGNPSTEEQPAVQQVVEVTTSEGEKEQVALIGEAERGEQTVQITDESGRTTIDEVKVIETPSGEDKLVLPDVDTPVIVPEVPQEVIEQAEQTGEQVQAVNVVTDSGETEQVIIQGEPDEHGDVTVQIPDNEGGYTETTATVQESYNGEQKIVVETTDGDVIQVPVPEPVSESLGNPSTEEQPAVQQVVEVTTSEGEKEQVALIGEAERGEQTVQITDESGRTTIDEVKVIETPSGEDKLVLPDVDTPVIVPEVPQEVIEQAEQTGEQVQAVNVVTDSGETEQVIIQGEPDEHGDVTVQIPDNEGGYTETTATVQESYNGEQKIVVETTDGDVIQVPVPEPVSESLGNPSTEEQPAVQQVVEVTTSEGEKEQVALIGEAERGEQTVQITDESGRTTIDEVKVIETPSGEDKLVLPDVDTPVIVPEVPQEVIEQAEQTGEQVQAVNVVTDSGETEQVIIQGEPDEHGDVTVQIPDNEGGYTETTATVQESYNGEQKIVVETTDGDVIQVPVPEPVSESLGNPSTEEQPAVQQVVEVTTSEGEKEQVALIGEAERGEQTVQITDESGRTTIDEVKVIETPSGEDKLVLPDVDTPVIVPEVPQEVIEQAEQTGEQVQAVNVVTDSGETEQVIIQGEPDEHGDVTVQIPDNEGGYTETTATVQESYNGEQKIVVETTDGDVIQVPVPEPVSESLGNPSTEEQPAVQQVVEVTTSEGEKEQVALIGEAERGEQTVQITDESGRTTIDEVKVIETPSGEDKLVLPDVDTPVIVPEVPQEVIEQAEQTGEQVQAVNVVTDSGETEQVIIQGEPDEHGDVTVQIPDNEGGYTETTATVQESYNGEQKIVVETTDGDVIQVPVPEPVSESLGNPSTEEQPAVQQVVEVTTSEGEKEQVALIGEAERGEQTVQITDESGRTTIDEVKVIETPSGEDKLVLPDVDTPVIVPEVPQEVIEQAEQTGEQVQAVNVVTDSGETEQVIIQGEPDEHGDVTVQIPDNEGGYTETTATVQESYNGEQKIVVETTDGDVIQVPVPEPVSESLGNPSTEEQPAVQQVVEVTTSEGEKEQVALIGEAERGEQTVQITDESGRTTIDEVKVIETPSGEDKLVLPDVDTPVIVPEVPQEVIEQAEQTGEQVQAVNVVTDSGETEQVIIQGEPDEHGKETVSIVDDNGEVTTQEVKVQETPSGEEKIEVATDNGYVSVDVPEPVAYEKEGTGEHGGYEQPQQESNYMTKVEFRDWIAKHYEDKLSYLKEEEKKLEEEVRAKAGRVKGLEDCIEQAANKFGYYGVYEQPPHFQNAVDWVQNECWAQEHWEPESSPEHRMLRR